MTTDSNGISPTFSKISLLNNAAPPRVEGTPAKVINVDFARSTQDQISIKSPKKSEKTALIETLNTVISDHNLRNAGSEELPAPSIDSEGSAFELAAVLNERIKSGLSSASVDPLAVHSLDLKRVKTLLAD